LRKLIAGTLMLLCSFSTAVNASSYRLPNETTRYQPAIRVYQAAGRWSEEGRRRRDEERRRQDEERLRQEEERRRREEERRRQEEERRRQDEQRRRQDEQRRRDEERRRQEEERRRREVPPPPPPHRRTRPGIDLRIGDSLSKARARRVLRETADYLVKAQWAARRRHYYFGLGKAYAHQEEARKLYAKRWYRNAIDHSMRAREIAKDVIEANRPGRRHRYGPPPEYDDSIDNELSVNIRDDKAVLSLRIRLD
jgi:hypothetical protein